MDSLFIIIPAYNEEVTIVSVIREWHDVAEKINGESRLVVIDDGSKDDTYKKAKALEGELGRLLVLTKNNSGQGATVRFGYNYAIENGADYIFQTDSDGQTDPSDFWKFWAIRSDHSAIIGYRKDRKDGISRVMVSKILKYVLLFSFKVNIKDANTPFRLMKADALRKYLPKIDKDYFLSNVLLSVFLVKFEGDVRFVRIEFKKRQGGANSINLKRIIRIGFRALFDFQKINKQMAKENFQGHDCDIALIRVNANSLVINPHLGIACLSSYLKHHGYKTLIIDALRDKLDNNKILNIIRTKNIRAAGISCLSAEYSKVISLSRLLKEMGIKVVIGGIHPSFMPWQTLNDSKADYVICGEGEIALLELLENNFSNIKNGIRIKGVHSLQNLTDENTSFEKGEIVRNLDDLPFPDWKQIPPGSFPPAPHGTFVKHFPVGIISSSRGCPYFCSFCASPSFYDRKIRFRSAENIIKEMILLIEDFGVREIQFCDDNLTMNREHITDICNLIMANRIKINWSCPNGVRADCIDEGLIKLMKHAGCYMCNVGVESANEAILKNIKKNESIETIQRAIQIIKSNKLICNGAFIYGLPGETGETLKQSLDFALNSGLDRANFNTLGILPGSDLWKKLKNGDEYFVLRRTAFPGAPMGARWPYKNTAAKSRRPCKQEVLFKTKGIYFYNKIF